MPAVTETFRLDTAPAMGIDTTRSHVSRTRRRSPVPSAPTTNAVGNVYGNGALAGYRNQLVSSPTLFPFAKGGVPNYGLMGEAGTEAIVPLKRDSQGNLGVSSSGGGRGNLIVNIHGAPGEAQVDYVRANFDYDVMLDRYEEVYHHVIGDPLKEIPSQAKAHRKAAAAQGGAA